MRIPKLPSGVSIFQDRSGNTEYWVLRLGKRWTGGQVVRRTFPTAGEAKKAWEQEVSKRNALGTGGYELSPAQLGEAISCFHQLEGTRAFAFRGREVEFEELSTQDGVRSLGGGHSGLPIRATGSRRSAENPHRPSANDDKNIIAMAA
ncbi:MAG: hypothetical protein PHC88_11550 [Terrimicrobiaceae bacterium]|nr:hypothetical protein [Terrimicrobiaceae bacterium]